MTHSTLSPMRLLAGVLIAAYLLCAATAAAAASTGDDALAPGWQAHARPLFMEGPAGLGAGTLSWYVPQDLPKGRYALVERTGDQARVIRERGFEARATGFTEIHLLLPGVYSNVEAIPVSDLPARAATAGKP